MVDAQAHLLPLAIFLTMTAKPPLGQAAAGFAVYFGAVLIVGLGFARLWRASEKKRRSGSIRIR